MEICSLYLVWPPSNPIVLLISAEPAGTTVSQGRGALSAMACFQQWTYMQFGLALPQCQIAFVAVRYRHTTISQ